MNKLEKFLEHPTVALTSRRTLTKKDHIKRAIVFFEALHHPDFTIFSTPGRGIDEIKIDQATVDHIRTEFINWADNVYLDDFIALKEGL